MKNIRKPTFSLSHIGINSENVDEAKNIASFLTTIFDFEQNEGIASIFVERSLEIIKLQGLGVHGHIAFYTDNTEIAVKYLEEKGIIFNYESVKYNENDELSIVYLEQEIGGFAIHLTNKK